MTRDELRVGLGPIAADGSHEVLVTVGSALVPQCDDYEGPMKLLGGDPEGEGAWMPLLSREARDGEWAHRHCDRCRLGQARWPVGQAPSRAKGVVVTDP